MHNFVPSQLIVVIGQQACEKLGMNVEGCEFNPVVEPHPGYKTDCILLWNL